MIPPFKFTLGGKRCYDRVPAMEAVRSAVVPPAYFDRANSLLNPLGRAPARGWLLMLQRDLDLLDLNALHDLVLTDDSARSVTAKNLCFAAEPLCIAPGTSGDEGSLYLCEMGDARWRCANPFFEIPANKQYNIRLYAYGAATGDAVYLSGSLNAGAHWTWKTMVDDLWGLLTPLGSVPTLPITPDGVPEAWAFPGVSAWEALCDILDKISCAVSWNPQTGVYSIVSVGATDAPTEAIITTAAQTRLLYDSQYKAVIRGRVPYGVAVFFHRLDQYGQSTSQWQTGAVHEVDVAATEADILAGAEPGVYTTLWDDLPAIYDATGSLSNGAALTTRATERGAQFFNSIRGEGGGKRRQRFSGLLQIQPKGTLKGVGWLQDDDGGMVTEVIRHPWGMLRINETGWQECCCSDSTAIKPPDLSPTYPIVPPSKVGIKVGLNVQTTDVPNMAGSFTPALDPTLIPANTLTKIGDTITLTTTATYAATASTDKQVRIVFAGVTVYDTGALAIVTAKTATFTTVVTMTGVGTQDVVTTVVTDSNLIPTYAYSATTYDETTATAMKIEAKGTNAGDVTLKAGGSIVAEYTTQS